MMIEKIYYLITLLCAIRAIACSDEIAHAIDSIESNTRPLRAFTNQRLAMNLPYYPGTICHLKLIITNQATILNMKI